MGCTNLLHCLSSLKFPVNPVFRFQHQISAEDVSGIRQNPSLTVHGSDRRGSRKLRAHTDESGLNCIERPVWCERRSTELIEASAACISSPTSPPAKLSSLLPKCVRFCASTLVSKTSHRSIIPNSEKMHTEKGHMALKGSCASTHTFGIGGG